MKKLFGLAAVSAAVLGLVGACSDDEDTTSTSASTSTQSSTASSTVTTSTSSTVASTSSSAGGQGGSAGGEGGMAAGGTGGTSMGGAGGSSTAGDDCSNVIAASLGSNYLDTNSFANDYSSYACGTSSLAAVGAEAVLSIGVPGGQYLAAVYDTTYDGVIVGYDQCDPTVAAACVGNDDSDGIVEGFTHQNTTVNAQTLFVFTDGYAATDTGPFDLLLNVYDPTAGGDTCANAIVINKTAAQQVGGTTLAHAYAGFAADYDPTSAGCTAYAEPGSDVVFSIVLDTTDLMDVQLRPAAGKDIGLYLLVGNCSDPLVQCVAGSDIGYGGDPETISAYSPPANGTTVYIVVDGWMTSETDNAFALNVGVY